MRRLISGGQRGSGRIRTADTEIFNLLLYQLSYRANPQVRARSMLTGAGGARGKWTFAVPAALAWCRGAFYTRPMTLRLAARFLLLGWLCGYGALLRAVELVEGPVVEATGTTATIRWKTDVVCGTRVRFGLSEDHLDGRVGEGVALAHEVTIAGLKPDTAYAYSVGTAKTWLKSDIFITAKSEGKGWVARLKEKLAGGPATRSGQQEAASTRRPTTKSPPPASQTWGSLRTLQDHFDRHGADFHATSPEDYARQAWEFLQRAKAESLPAKLDASDGTVRVWDPKSGAFGAYNRDDTTKTYFKPGSPDYFARQPGRALKLKPD